MCPHIGTLLRVLTHSLVGVDLLIFFFSQLLILFMPDCQPPSAHFTFAMNSVSFQLRKKKNHLRQLGLPKRMAGHHAFLVWSILSVACSGQGSSGSVGSVGLQDTRMQQCRLTLDGPRVNASYILHPSLWCLCLL